MEDELDPVRDWTWFKHDEGGLVFPQVQDEGRGDEETVKWLEHGSIITLDLSFGVIVNFSKWSWIVTSVEVATLLLPLQQQPLILLLQPLILLLLLLFKIPCFWNSCVGHELLPFEEVGEEETVVGDEDGESEEVEQNREQESKLSGGDGFPGREEDWLIVAVVIFNGDSDSLIPLIPLIQLLILQFLQLGFLQLLSTGTPVIDPPWPGCEDGTFSAVGSSSLKWSSGSSDGWDFVTLWLSRWEGRKDDEDENDGDENDEDDEIGGQGIVKLEENIWFLFFFKTSNFRLGEWNFLPFNKWWL